MELVHTFTVPASVEDTWAHFMDLEAVGGCFPGATITDVSGDDFSGTVKVKLGPIALLYAGTGRFVVRDHAAYRAEIEAMGKDRRGNGTAGAKVRLSLSPDPQGARCEVVTDLAVTGKPAQFGRGVMQDVSDKLLQAFLECLQVQLAGRGPAGYEERAAGEAGTGAAGGSAAADGAAEPGGSGGSGGSGGDATSAAAGTSAGAPAEPDAPSPAAPTGSAGPAAPAARVGLGTASRPPMPRSMGGSGPSAAGDDALDLGSAVVPVLAKTYGPYLLAGMVGLVIGLAVRRRRS